MANLKEAGPKIDMFDNKPSRWVCICDNTDLSDLSGADGIRLMLERDNRRRHDGLDRRFQVVWNERDSSSL